MFFRILSAVTPTSDGQDEGNEEEQRQQILKALLQFYQESEVKTRLDDFYNLPLLYLIFDR